MNTGSIVRSVRIGVCAFSAASIPMVCPAADPSNVVLSHGSTSAIIDFTTQAGMHNWTVGGVDQLNKQWFWWRVGGSGAESSLDTIANLSVTTSGNNYASATFNNGNFSVTIEYLLTSISSTKADIAENITINNLTGDALDFHFFQYSDFNLAGIAGGDTIEIFPAGGGGYDQAYQSKNGNIGIVEGIIDPSATYAEAGLTTDLPLNTLGKLTDGSTTTLNNTLGPRTGDATWALQWDMTIAGFGSVEVLKDKLVSVTAIPEPGALGLLGLAMAGLALRRVRR